jgi:hypothetical protein
MADLAFFQPTPLVRSEASVLSIIKQALTKIGVIDASRSLTDDEAVDGLEELNGILEQWSMESLNVFRVGDIRFMTIAGQKEYRIGPGEYIDAERPHSILTIRTSTTSNELIEVQEYSPRRPLSGREAGYDPAYPAGYITLGWPPTGEQLIMQVNQELRRYAQVSDPHGLPPGYVRPLVLALAVELAPSFDITPAPAIITSMLAAKSTLRKNASRLRLTPLTTGIARVNGPRRYVISNGTSF